MGGQQDLQELLRLLTVTRKVPIMQAMGQIKALQAANLKSIKDISEAELPIVTSAIKDEKQARALISACKAVLKRGGDTGTKRTASSQAAEPDSLSKRAKHSNHLLPGNSSDQLSPSELEASLALPLNTDEDLIAQTAVQTNRAPLVLAFAVELLRYTMPEQPPSSRLSLAQAVVSANSRSKAVSLGIEKGAAAEDEGWGTGQPKVRIMGRDVAVLKRGGYEWKGEEEVGGAGDDKTVPSTGDAAPDTQTQPQPQPQTQTQTSITSYLTSASTSTATSSTTHQPTSQPKWSTSPPLSLKKSTFIGRATALPSPSSHSSLLTSLFATHPSLKTATHNAWAYRCTHPSTGAVTEQSSDDGETGAGQLLLRVMRELGAADTLVVMTRWYGGVMLGPDRWRLMRNVVVSALTERLRRGGTDVVVGGEAVWGLDLEGMRSQSSSGRGGTTGQKGGGGWNMSSVVGTQIHAPQAARAYLLKSFASTTPEQQQQQQQQTSSSTTTAAAAAAAEQAADERDSPKAKKPAARKTLKVIDAEKEENLGLILGALRLLYDSWADHLTPGELDRRAWSWYMAVRPEVDSGPAGWGAKGSLRLADILKLRRKD